MSKVKTNLVIEEDLINKVREIADRNYWSLTAATELAFKLFIQRYADQLPLPSLAPDPQEKVVVS